MLGVGNNIEIRVGVIDEASKKLGIIQGRLRTFSSSLARMGRITMGVGLSAGAAVGIMMKAYGDFEENMAKVSTMLDENSMKYMPAFTEGIKKMATEFGEGTNTLSWGLYQILSAGVNASKAMDVLKASVIAAKAGMTDTATAADAITTVLNSYGLSADKAGYVSDWFFGIVKKGKTTFGELAPVIGRLTPVAKQAGLSLEEVGASLATLTANGIRTDEAVTAMRGVLNAFLKPTEESIELARQYGIELSTTTLKTEGFIGVLQKLKGIKPEDLAKIFPNIRALTGVLANMGSLAKYQENLNYLFSVGGATQEAYMKMTDTLKFKLSQLKEGIIDVAVSIGETLKSYIEKGIGIVKNLVYWFHSLSDEQKANIGRTILLVAEIGILGGAFILLISVLSKLPLIFSATNLQMMGFLLAGEGIVRVVGLIVGEITMLAETLANIMSLIPGVGGKFRGIADTMKRVSDSAMYMAKTGILGTVAKEFGVEFNPNVLFKAMFENLKEFKGVAVPTLKEFEKSFADLMNTSKLKVNQIGKATNITINTTVENKDQLPDAINKQKLVLAEG